MLYYTMIYTTYTILLLSDKLRRGPVKSMNSNEHLTQSLAMQATSKRAIRSLMPEQNS
jgi:hypothetical protein